jgi:hypothetical protein
MSSLLKRPSAWIPIAMSSIVLAVFIWHVTTYGVVRETDEGIGAHLFQILMPLQLPIIAFFAITWLPKSPREAIFILALQLLAALMVIAPVFIFQM